MGTRSPVGKDREEVIGTATVSAGVSGRRQGGVSDDGDSIPMSNIESSAEVAGNHSKILSKDFRAVARTARETALGGRQRVR